MRLHYKIIIFIAVLSLAIGLASTILVSQIMDRALEKNLEEKGKIITLSVVEQLTPHVINDDAVIVRELLQDIVRRTKDVDFAFVVGFENEIFAHSFDRGFPKELFTHYTRDLIRGEDFRSEKYSTQKGPLLMVGHPLIEGMKAHLHIGFNESSAHAQIKGLRNRILGITLLIALIGTLLGISFSRRITKPFRRLSESMMAFAKGREQQPPIDISGGGREVDELVHSFNWMIKKRKLAEEALRESEEKYRRLVDTMNEGLGVTDENYIFTYVNDKLCEILGYNREEMIGHHLTEFVAEDYKDKMNEQIERRKRGEDAPFELIWVSKDGHRIYTLAAPKGIFDSEGKFIGSFGVLTDITKIKNTEEELKKKTEEFEALYETGKKITSLVSKEELLPWVAEQAAKLLQADICNYRVREGDYLVRGGGTKEGLELMKKERLRIGESLTGWIAKEKKPLIIDNIREDERHIKEHRDAAEKFGFISFLGVPMMIGDNLVGVINIHTKKARRFTERDIELLSAFADHAAIAIHNSRLFEDLEKAKEELERWNKKLGSMVEERTKKLQKVQAQLIQSEGLAVTGRLAASVAHEINNPLQAIDSFVSSVMKNLDDKDSENIEHLKLTQEGIIRIANIVKQLLAFHRPGIGAKNLENINSIIHKTLSLTKNQLSLNKIRVREELCPDLPKTRISAQQIHQVLLNLILNAQDAMPEGGELKIKTAKNKNFISIEVSDTGGGIPEDFMSRIFEPFSTMKKGEKGTGLGLSISYGIIKAHKGDIQVKSREKEGTTFTIILPIDNY